MKYIENIKIILGFLPISACTYEVGTIEELVSVMDRDVWEDLSGVDIDWLNILLDKGIVDIDDINIILAQFGEL